MSNSKEKTKNIALETKEEFIKVFKENIKREGNAELLNYLENSNFFNAAASSRFHSSYEGGLAVHSLNCYKRFKNLIETERVLINEKINENKKDNEEKELTNHQKQILNITNESIAIIALLHDLCKVDAYKKELKSQKKRDENGDIMIGQNGKPMWEDVWGFVHNDGDLLPYGHGEKSVYMISGFMKLTREEALAINWHMGSFDARALQFGGIGLNNAYRLYPAASIFHLADMQATYLDEV